MTLEIITLEDGQSGSTARILPGFGFNCYSFCVADEGQPHELLWAAEGFDHGKERASGSGIPLLFPFAGRIRGGRFAFGGKTYELAAGDGQGNAIHGFVLDRPWMVVEECANRAVGCFDAAERDSSLLDHWPADFRITVSYEVKGRSLVSDILVENPDEKPLPFGLGTHPYFRIPLGGDGDPGECRIKVPVRKYWELENLLPTGKVLDAAGERALADGLRFADAELDDVFTGLDYEGSRATATIHDPGCERTLSIQFDDSFRECVVYNPPHREAICIEPYTSVPDAFDLLDRGIETGMRVLKPGEQFQARIEIRLD